MANPELDSFEDPAPPAGESALDIRAYWRIVSKRRWLIFAVFVASVVLTAGVSLRQQKIYSASATLVIDMSSPRVLSTNQVQDVVDSAPAAYWFSKEYYETQYNVLRSRAVAENVIELIRNSRNDDLVTIESGATAEVRDRGLKALDALRQQIAASSDPASLVQGRVTVEPVKESRIARLTVEDPDPLVATALANAFARGYMQYNLQSKSSMTSGAQESLEHRLPDLEAKLQVSGQALREYLRANNIIDSTWEDRLTTVNQRMARLNESLTGAIVRKATLKSKADAVAGLRKNTELDDPSKLALLPNEAGDSVRQLRMRYIDARAECEDLEERLLGQHPRLVSCRLKLANAAKALSVEIDAALQRMQAEYMDVVATEKNLLAELALVNSEAAALDKLAPKYSDLKLAHDTNRRLYDVAVKSLKETGLSGNTRLNNVSMLDAARPSFGPARPNVQRNVAGAALLGLLLGVLLAFLLEFLDNTVTTQEQVEELLRVAFLGIVPSVENAATKLTGPIELIVKDQPKSAVAECCRAIRTNLLFMSPDRPLRAMLVTSAGPREGKTTSSTCLALTMVESGNRVLLVDADLRRPRLHNVFGVPNTKGMSSLIVGEGKLDDAVRDSGIPGLSLLTCGPIPPNPAELLHTQMFKDLLEEMKSKFDRVIIDSPPIGAVADAVVISTLVDGTVLIVKSSVTSKDMAKRAVRTLKDVNARIFGVVLNDISLEDRHSGGYYYYSKYGYYYGENETPDGKAA